MERIAAWRYELVAGMETGVVRRLLPILRTVVNMEDLDLLRLEFYKPPRMAAALALILLCRCDDRAGRG